MKETEYRIIKWYNYSFKVWVYTLEKKVCWRLLFLKESYWQELEPYVLCIDKPDYWDGLCIVENRIAKEEESHSRTKKFIKCYF